MMDHLFQQFYSQHYSQHLFPIFIPNLYSQSKNQGVRRKINDRQVSNTHCRSLDQSLSFFEKLRILFCSDVDRYKFRCLELLLNNLQHFPIAVFICSNSFYITIFLQEIHIILNSSLTDSIHKQEYRADMYKCLCGRKEIRN